MIRSQKELFDIALSFSAIARTATANGTGVDTLGYNAATMVFALGAWTDGTHTYSIQESDVSGSGYTNVAAGSLDGTAPAVTDNTGVGTFVRVGYLGIKRYIRAVVTVTGSPSTGLVAGVHVVRAEPKKAPK